MQAICNEQCLATRLGTNQVGLNINVPLSFTEILRILWIKPLRWSEKNCQVSKAYKNRIGSISSCNVPDSCFDFDIVLNKPVCIVEEDETVMNSQLNTTQKPHSNRKQSVHCTELVTKNFTRWNEATR